MQPSFVSKIEDVQRRRQRRRLLVAVCWSLAAFVVGALALISLDWALGIQDLLGRVLWTVGFVFFCALVIRKWLVGELSQTISAYDVARQIERQHPELQDTVTSGLEFSGQSESDPWAGSAALRRAIVLRAATGIEEVDWKQLIPQRPLGRSLYALAVVSIVAGAFAWVAPQSLAIGVTRLLNPLSSAQWPRLHDLQFVKTPSLLAAGDDLVLELRDTRGTLPTELAMHYRFWRNRRWHEEAEPLVASGPSLSIRRANVQESLQYRAAGGDHQNMPWQVLEVVTPPRVTEWEITASSPPYAGLPEASFSERGRVLIGSQLHLRGKVDQPLAQVTLQSASGLKLPLELAADQQSFRLTDETWLSEQSDTFSLEMTTLESLTTKTGQLLTLEVVPDAAPKVHFELPLQDLSVVPTAEVQLVVTAQDDLAVKDAELVYLRSDRSEQGEYRKPLLHGPQVVEDLSKQAKQQVNFLWQLAPLALKPGSGVEIHARASDYQPVSGQTSHPLRLTVVTSAEMLRRISQRLTQVLDEIEQLLGGQREIRASTAAWAEGPDWSVERWASQGHVALFRQRQIARRLIEDPEAVQQQLAALTADLQRNRLQRPETDARLQDLQIALRRLAAGPLPALDRALGKLIRQTETRADALECQPLIQKIAEHQDQVIVTLEQALARLALGEQLGRFERELRTLSSEQIEIQKECTQLATSLLDSGGNTETQVITSVASRQRQLAGRLAQLIRRMSSATRRLAAENLAAASRVELTVGLTQKLGVQATMLQAGDLIAARRLGRAASLQREVAQDLQKLLSELTERSAAGKLAQIGRMQEVEHGLQRHQVALARLEIAQLDSQLAGFQRRQTAVADQLKRLDGLRQSTEQFTLAEGQSITRLAESQDALHERSVELAERIESLSVFAHLLRTAADGMQQVSDRLTRQATGAPTQQVAQEVLDQLQLLSDAVKEEKKSLSAAAGQGTGVGNQTGNNAQAESLQVALGQLKLLRSLQLVLQQRTRAIESKIAADGQVPVEALAEARELATRQQQLTRVALQLQTELADPPPESLLNLEEALK